jgi:hypothetical protein
MTSSANAVIAAPVSAVMMASAQTRGKHRVTFPRSRQIATAEYWTGPKRTEAM